MDTILNKLNFAFDVAPIQDELFTPSHVKYVCRIVNRATRRRYTFDYQCNPRYTDITLKDTLYCLLSDAQCVEYTPELADFLIEFDYVRDPDTLKKGVKAFKGCQRTKKALERLFTAEELTALEEYYQDY